MAHRVPSLRSGVHIVALLVGVAVLLTETPVGQTQPKHGTISNLSTVVDGDLVRVSYDLESDDPGVVFTVRLEFSQDGGQTYQAAETVDGDVGLVLRGQRLTIIWSAGRDIETVSFRGFELIFPFFSPCFYRQARAEYSQANGLYLGFPICPPRMAPLYTYRQRSARNACSSQHRPASEAVSLARAAVRATEGPAFRASADTAPNVCPFGRQVAGRTGRASACRHRQRPDPPQHVAEQPPQMSASRSQ